MTLLRLLSTILIIALTACALPDEAPLPEGTNLITVIGAIHSGHKSSDRFSLNILRNAITEFKPDVVLVELPPDRLQIASDNFVKFGAVKENRADDFPELTDVLFPLRQKLGFTMVPVAAWTQEIADDRSAVMRRLENDPSRDKDWAEYQAAIRTYNQAVAGKSDDPQYIHSHAYDEAVRARQETLQRLFGDELGAGGWKKINQAHLALINAALNDLRGQEKRVLILYGAWHKYKILEGLEGRSNIHIIRPNQLF